MLLVCTIVAGEEAATDAEAVLTLTKSNFDEKIKKTERMLVEFYAPWCGHCKQLEPEYKQAATIMKTAGFKTLLAKVDATAENDLAQKYGVSGYPTIKYFVNGQVAKDYDGDRQAPGIVDWLKKKELPAYETLDENQVEKFLKEADTEGTLDSKDESFAVVARIKKKSARAKAFIAAVQDTLIDYEASKIRYGVVWLPKTADPKADAKLTIARPDFVEPDAQQLEYSGAWNDLNIVKWVKNATFATVGSTFSAAKYSPSDLESLGYDAAVVAVLDDDSLSEDDEEEPLKPKLQPMLMAMTSKFPTWRFTVVDQSEVKEDDLTLLGAKKGSEALISVLHGGKKYVLESPEELLKTGAVESFLDDIKAKRAQPHYKSGPKPAQLVDDEGITVLVGKNFEEVVLDSKKDVFVEFYAPWCGHCKKLAPEWASLAKQVKTNGWDAKGVTIAKMDATENESQEEVTGFPKLVLYPAVKADKKMKSKQVYNGARELDPMIDFLLENARKLEGVEITAEKKSGSFSMIDRERAKKKGKKSEL